MFCHREEIIGGGPKVYVSSRPLVGKLSVHRAAFGMAEPSEAADAAFAVDDARARLLCSFVPALMLSAMDKAQAAIEPPTTHEYQAVALFAVRCARGVRLHEPARCLRLSPTHEQRCLTQ